MSHNSVIAKNTLVLYIRMFIVTLISLYTSRIVLKTLGIEDFGIYNIAGGLISFFAVINTAMSSSVQRFLNVELGKNDSSSFSKTFNIGIEIHVLIAIAIFLLGETIGVYAYFEWLNIPTERVYAGHVVYQLSLLSTVVTIIKTPFNALIIAKERMTIFAYISILETLGKLMAVLVLIFLPFDCLIAYAAGIFGLNIIIFLYTVLYSYKSLNAPSFYWLSLKSSTSKQMIKFSAWNFLGNISNVFTWQGINFLLNIFLGVTFNAAIGITNQVTNTVSSFITSFQVAYKPSIIQYYIKDKQEFLTLVCRASKYSFFLLFIIIYPLYFNIDPILHLWLGNVPQYSSIFVRILLFSLIINSINTPFYNTLEAHGKIFFYQIINTITTPLILIYAYIVLRCGISPAWVIFSHVAISLCLLVTSILLIYKMRIIPINIILTKVIIPIVKVITIAILLAIIVSFNSTFSDIIVKIISSIVIICCVGMSKDELSSVTKLIQRKLKW